MKARADNIHDGGRDGYAILGALRRREYNFSKVARDVDISSQLVRETAHGRANNRKALTRMLEIGVPPDVLQLPPDLLTAAQAAQGTAA